MKQFCTFLEAAGNPRIRITIVEDVAVGTKTARIILLAVKMIKDPKLIWQSKIC
jgi:hypothetical protein